MKAILLLLFVNHLSGITLQEMYDTSESLNGYDKYVILDGQEVYQGGIGIYEGTVFIDCNGAVIDLAFGNGIWIYSDQYMFSSLDVKNCSIINGEYYGISYAGNSTGNVINCNFINNDYGIKFYDTSNVYVTNVNFIESSTYAIGIYSTTPQINLEYCNFWNYDEGDLSEYNFYIMENCPGWGSVWTPWEFTNECEGLLSQNPSFIDEDNLIFSYNESSPCIDSGNPNYIDSDGSISDIGAISFNQNQDNCTVSYDTNNDGLLNILDVVDVINFILYDTTLNCNIDYDDGNINVLTIISMINLILEQY